MDQPHLFSEKHVALDSILDLDTCKTASPAKGIGLRACVSDPPAKRGVEEASSAWAAMQALAIMDVAVCRDRLNDCAK